MTLTAHAKRSKCRAAPAPVETPTQSSRRLIAFGWYGGKFSHLGWLLQHLPKCHHYCEPFGGSASVLLNRTPSPVETYNDLDGHLTTFFKVLREQTDELVRVLALTPFSRAEFVASLQPAENLPELEIARRFFVRARQVRTGLAQTASPGRWATCRSISRSGMSGAISRWIGSVEMLPEIAERLLRVQIENRAAIDVIERYDSPDTLFYCDPPYPHNTRGDAVCYAYEMSDEQHAELADRLKAAKGNVVISGYRCAQYDKLYRKWTRVEAKTKNCHASKEDRTECIWIKKAP